MGQSIESVNKLLAGDDRITIATARHLEQVLGASVEFWVARDYAYQKSKERINEADTAWFNGLPIKEMIQFGWIDKNTIADVLHFFGVSNLKECRNRFHDLQRNIAYRASPTFTAHPASIAAWLRQGELIAQTIRCEPWNQSRFEDSIPHLRSLTRSKKPDEFIPELQDICAKCGAAIVILRAPSKSHVSGATRFLTSKKALIMLSFRYLTDDHFWFTFFHEVGHLVLHRQKDLFIEDEDLLTTTEEQQANQFAEEVLIPAPYQTELSNLTLTQLAISRFAKKIGVSPGIVVGQLQHHKRIPFGHMNSLKMRFTWQD
jgi:Zn-dependent peptidase ImmA (M78 family)/transcriptional regulator with XRE-family HTH domain